MLVPYIHYRSTRGMLVLPASGHFTTIITPDHYFEKVGIEGNLSALKLAEREGFGSAAKRSFNMMQVSG